MSCDILLQVSSCLLKKNGGIILNEPCQLASIFSVNYPILFEGVLIKIMLSNGELVVALRRQINSDRDRNATAIDKISDQDRLIDRDRLFSQHCSMIF